MRVVVDDEETQPIEIDADHGASKYARGRECPTLSASVKWRR
jgi:hypothetical protein